MTPEEFFGEDQGEWRVIEEPKPDQIQFQESPRPKVTPKGSLLGNIIKEPIKNVIARPALRAGQAIGRLGIELFGSDALKQRAQEASERPVTIPGLGITVKGVGTGKEAAKQITGEAISSAADIASFAGVGGAAGKVLSKPAAFWSGARVGAIEGAKLGTLYGGVKGFAYGLEEDKSLGQSLKQAGIGAATGGVFGGLIGGAVGGVSGSVRGYFNRRAELKAAEQVLAKTDQDVQALRDTIHQSGTKITTLEGAVPKKMIYQKGDILEPKVAHTQVEELRGRLNEFLPGLGDDFADKVNTSASTLDDIIQAADDTIDDRLALPKSTAAYTLSDKGEMIKDKTARRALDLGYDERDVNFVKNASPSDKSTFQQMYKVSKLASQDRTYPRQAIELPGEKMIDTAKYLVKQRSNIGKEIGTLVKGLPSSPIRVTDVYDDFLDDLSSAGIKVTKTGLDFQESRYANSPAIQKQLQSIFNDLTPDKLQEVLRTPQTIHTLRQKIFTDLDLGKASNQFDDYSEVIMRKVRDNLEKPLLIASPEYKKLATNYARSTNALNGFNQLIGKDFNLFDDYSNLRAGEVGQRILGSASSKPLKIINNVQDLARELGYKTEGNIRDQLIFADILDDTFGSPQTRQMREAIRRGTTEALEAAQKPQGIPSRIASYTMEKLKAITPEEKQNVLWELITRKPPHEGAGSSAAKAVTGYIKNVQPGLSIKDVTAGETGKALARNIMNEIETSAHAEGVSKGLTPKDIYANGMNGVYKPSFAKGRISDIADKLEKAYPGEALGAKFRTLVPLNEASPEKLIQKAMDLVFQKFNPS